MAPRYPPIWSIYWGPVLFFESMREREREREGERERERERKSERERVKG